MPELIMERPKMSLQMHETLKRYILRERKKKKEEDVANEQKMREELKKAEMTTQTLENNKEQLKQLNKKLEDLQHKKRDLFNQLKKVILEETKLKNNNRVSLPQPGMIQGDHSNPLSMLMYQAHPGHPQMLTPQQQTPQILVQAPSLNNLPPQSSILPIGAIPSGTNQAQVSSNGPESLNKAQPPFHPPHHLIAPPSHHLSQHNSSNFLKYLQNQSLPISPQIIQNQNSLLVPPNSINPNLLNQNSPSSSPHLLTSSPRHNLSSLGQSNVKRQRSPTPPSSPLPIHTQNLLHNQFIFGQNQLIHQPSISPASLIPSSPPPLSMNSIPQSSFNSPSSNKKVRPVNAGNINQSPQQQIQRQTSQSSNQSQQQQSAFSSYLNNRSNLSGFQSPSAQHKNSSTSNVNIPGPHFSSQHSSLLPPQTPPGQGYNLPRGMIPQPGPQLPVNLQQQFPHYLNSLTQEQAKNLFLQQQQHQQFGNIHQAPHYSNISSIPMISAAAAAAVAAASQSANLSGNTGSGGSILTGFSVRTNNPSNSSQQNSHQY